MLRVLKWCIAEYKVNVYVLLCVCVNIAADSVTSESPVCDPPQ